jgi:hypothetical protein
MLFTLDSNFCLDSSTVEDCVAECAGAYALGSLDDNGTMVVKCIGRADDNVKARLKAHAVERRCDASPSPIPLELIRPTKRSVCFAS